MGPGSISAYRFIMVGACQHVRALMTVRRLREHARPKERLSVLSQHKAAQNSLRRASCLEISDDAGAWSNRGCAPVRSKTEHHFLLRAPSRDGPLLNDLDGEFRQAMRRTQIEDYAIRHAT